MKNRILFRVLFLTVLLSSNIYSQWLPIPTVNNPISTQVASQSGSSSTSDGSGGAIIAWVDSRNGDSDIYAQRIDNSGIIIWTLDGVDICTASDVQSSLSIESDGSGGAIITWQDFRNGSDYDIYAQRINTSGVVAWAQDGVAICTAAGVQSSPKLVSDGNGGAFITWQSGTGFAIDIYAQGISSSGTVLWPVTTGVAICTAPFTQSFPAIVSDELNGAIITWNDVRNGIDNNIYAQKLNNSGVQWTANGVPVSLANGNQSAPAIAGDGNNGAIITWMDDRNGSDSDIYVQRINSSGGVLWNSMVDVAISTVTGSQVFPAIVSDGLGGAIITWQDFRNGDPDIYAQGINNNGGVSWTADGVAICTASGGQYGAEYSSPTIVSDGSNGAIITWYDGRNLNVMDIYAQGINSSGVVTWAQDGIAICTAPQSQYTPTIVSDGGNGAIITWVDNRNGNPDIYTSKIEQPIVVLDSASICGMKFNDLNGNANKDSGELGLSGWEIQLSYNQNMVPVVITDTTDQDGNYCFNNLQPGVTYTVSEENQSGWVQTLPGAPFTYTVTALAGQNYTMFFGNQQQSTCIDFEDGTFQGWQVNNTLETIILDGTNHYIETTDQAGASTFFNESRPLVGDWTTYLTDDSCGSLCWDVNYLYAGDGNDGSTQPITITPTITIFGGSDTAVFVTNNLITAGDGWHSYCAPLSWQNPDGTLPSNTDGHWEMTAGSNISNWNTMLSNITRVQFSIDPTSYQNERFGFDNICLSNTGDCDSPVELGSICGMKFNDLNGNGVQESGELGLENWIINLTYQNAAGAITLSDTTDMDGNYCFDNLQPGVTYTVSEENQSGWVQTLPGALGEYTIILADGENSINNDFGNTTTCSYLGNSGFEEFNNVNPPTTFFWFPQADIPYWQTTASDGLIEIWHSGFGNVPAYSGEYFAELNATQVGTLYQSFYATASQSVIVSFAHRGRYDGDDVMEVSIGPDPNGPFTNLGTYSDDNTQWIYYSTASYPITNTGNYILKFESISSDNGNGPSDGGNFLDSISVACISSCTGTDFEDGTFQGWQVNNTLETIILDGTNHYIETTDLSGASSLFNDSIFNGNWENLIADSCGGSLNFDVNFLYGGDPFNGVNPPQTTTPWIAISNATFSATFIIDNPISVGSGWHSFTAPIRGLNFNGTMPFNADGHWVMGNGTNSDWTTLLSNVTRVQLPVDPTSYQSEKFGYDNICLSNIGDCDSLVSVDEDKFGKILPKSFKLEQNYPNPFNPSTTFRYQLPQAANVQLIIYNNLGQVVRRLVNSQQAAGEYETMWDGKDYTGRTVASGVYLYRIHAGDFVQTRKMLLLK